MYAIITPGYDYSVKFHRDKRKSYIDIRIQKDCNPCNFTIHARKYDQRNGQRVATGARAKLQLVAKVQTRVLARPYITPDKRKVNSPTI